MPIKRISRVLRRFAALPARITRIQEALGRIEQRQIERQSDSIGQAEFRVFSQWGEDGIIQFLLGRIPLARPVFIEFGVENYVESNTRFLLTNNHWSGLVIDGSKSNIEYIKRDPIYWACNLKVEHSFITTENINRTLTDNGMSGDIGLLSVDIDGNDYWVWQAIDCISPRVVICEYNSHYGPTAAVTIPYDPEFVRTRAHYSGIYYGASIAALCALATEKGYSLVAGNSAGNNVFFVRNDVIGALPVLSPAAAYRRPQFRECHTEHGELSFEGFEQRLNRIAALPVYDLGALGMRLVGELNEAGPR